MGTVAQIVIRRSRMRITHAATAATLKVASLARARLIFSDLFFILFYVKKRNCNTLIYRRFFRPETFFKPLQCFLKPLQYFLKPLQCLQKPFLSLCKVLHFEIITTHRFFSLTFIYGDYIWASPMNEISLVSQKHRIWKQVWCFFFTS